MFFKNANYYKGYDIDNKNRLEKFQNEYANPYGYNLESNVRREIDYDKNAAAASTTAVVIYIFVEYTSKFIKFQQHFFLNRP